MKTARTLFPLFLMLALLLSACAQTGIPATGDDVLDVSINVTDTGIAVPEQVTPGLANFIVTNATGLDSQEVVLVRLNTGVTLDQFLTSLRQDEMEAVGLVGIVAGRETGLDQDSNFSTVLEEGTYVVLVFNPEEDVPPMTGVFQVAGASRPTTNNLPQAQVTVDMVDFNFVMPEVLPSGPSTWEITNSGTQWHHIVIVRPQPGVTEQQILEMAQSGPPEGPPPWEQIAYFGPQTQGERAWINVDLTPGTYMAICFLPDFATGESHLERGMIRTFQVGE
jgi:hypothetical protein